MIDQELVKEYNEPLETFGDCVSIERFLANKFTSYQVGMPIWQPELESEINA